MYKSDNQVKTYHNLQPRSHQQNYSSVKNIQQNTTYLLPYQANSNHLTYNNYQGNRSYSAPVKQVFNPQSSVGQYYNNQVYHQQYHGQLQILGHPHGQNRIYNLGINNGKYPNYLLN